MITRRDFPELLQETPVAIPVQQVESQRRSSVGWQGRWMSTPPFYLLIGEKV